MPGSAISKSPSIVRLKRGKKIICPKYGCLKRCSGYEIEKAFDTNDMPIWAISYVCKNGHKFIGEYERNAKKGSI